MTHLRIALAQINSTVGDLSGNEQKIRTAIARAHDLGADVVALPELAVTGYPPEDLLLKPGFVEANLIVLRRLAAVAPDVVAVVGFVDRGDDIYNAAAVLYGGQVAAVYHKSYLPNYGVFDEDRYFRAGDRPLVLSLGDAQIGINICEDVWYPTGPTEAQAWAGAQLIINISASPYHAGKGAARERMLATRAADHVVAMAFCNLVGGQDELVFDGGSVVLNELGEVVGRGRQFVEDMVVADLNLGAVFRQRLHDPRRRKERPVGESVQIISLASRAGRNARPPAANVIEPPLDLAAEVYAALTLGVGDYVRKNGFEKIVIGLSGGVDSALTACIAVDALGAQNVVGVFMPTRYSSDASREDATQLAANLGIRFLIIPIDDIFQSFLDTLAEAFAGTPVGVAEENIQARIRGSIWMALSNKFGWMALTAGNKSEMSTGYATLYGDMAGGFAAIKDVPKMLVYRLAGYVNERAGREVIPERIFTKAPTAELRPNQTDQDTLPPYALLDDILHSYVEQDCSVDEMVDMGFDRGVVQEVVRMVDRAEYKRRQAPPGVKITPRAFGRDRRLPITNRYRDRGD